MNQTKNCTISKKERLDYLDVVKGISTLFVIFCHTVTANTPLHNCYLYFMLPSFFCATGILLAHNPSFLKMSYVQNIKKNILTILYPYLTFSLISILSCFIKEIFLTSNDFFTILGSILDIIKSTISLYGYSVLWFLPTLFFSKIIFIFFEKKSINKWIVLSLSILTSSILSTCLAQFSGMFIPIIIFISRTLIGLSFIYIGYLFYILSTKINTKIKSKHFYTIISIFIFISTTIPCYHFSRVDIHYSFIGNPVIFYLFATLSSLSLITFCKYALNKCKFLINLGKHSLIVFATHLSCDVLTYSWLIISLIKKLIQMLLSYSLSDNILYILVFILVILIETLIIIPVINKYFKFILTLPKKNKK